MKEFDGDDDKWLGLLFKLQSFLNANYLGYEGMIDRILQENGATNLNNAVLSTADKRLSSSLYYVLGLTMIDESKSLKIVRNVVVGEGAIAGLAHARHDADFCSGRKSDPIAALPRRVGVRPRSSTRSIRQRRMCPTLQPPHCRRADDVD